MEIIAQWLDDLDDILLAIPAVLERLRWRSLQVSMGAATGMMAVVLADRCVELMPILAGLAAASLLLWGAGLAAAELASLTIAGFAVSLRPRG
jgi:hypothetical protein